MLQDPSHRHESSPPPRSDSAEVVPSVTDSQHERAMIQVSSQLDEHLSHENSALVEVVSKDTESEAVRLLAARVPPELFENILFYVNVDRVSQREEVFRTNGKYLARNRGQPSPIDVLTDLKQCSLVCLFWANKCREHMFSERTLEIRSYEDADIFRRYVVEGCPRLTPVHQVISGIRVYQDYESRPSFLHLLDLPIIQDKLDTLFINGPVPDSFNRAKLDTPHWSTPPCIVVPSSFLHADIHLKNVDFPSFYHIIKYIRHFSHATFIQFEKITWNRQMVLSLPHTSSTLTCRRRPRSLGIRAERVCTDAVHLALTALMMNPNCPLHRLSDEERVGMTKFMTLLWGDVPNPDVRIDFDVSEQRTTMRVGLFHFVFEGAPLTDRSASALSVVGMHAYIDDFDLRTIPANFDALVNHARTQPTIRALVLLFDSFDHLQDSLKHFVEVLALETGTIELVLAYKKEDGRVVSVDPNTLEHNDCLWADLQGWYGELESLEILQRQLKKKRWMSLH